MKVSAFSIVLSLILYLSTFHSGCGDYGACTKRSDCCENMACVKNECSPCIPDSNQCQTDTCCDGFYCKNGACMICPVPGITSCTKDDDCQVGQNCKDLKCQDGVCVTVSECSKYYESCQQVEDDKCCPGLGCYLGGNKCAYPKALGQFCGTDWECADEYKCIGDQCQLCGSTAPCKTDSNCCGDLTCVNKKCHDKNGDDCFGLNKQCTSNDDCCLGLRCSNGQCQGCKTGSWSVCSSEDQNCCTGYVCSKTSQTCEICPGSLPPDKTRNCDSNADCALGGCTGTVCVNKVCKPSGYCLDGSSNIICNSNEECCKGLVCKAGNCVSCHGSGQTCSESADCCNGYWCSDGKCKSSCGSQ